MRDHHALLFTAVQLSEDIIAHELAVVLPNSVEEPAVTNVNATLHPGPVLGV